MKKSGLAGLQQFYDKLNKEVSLTFQFKKIDCACMIRTEWISERAYCDKLTLNFKSFMIFLARDERKLNNRTINYLKHEE